jgi:acetylornithine deacetylase/succinyl-diaminopimelate desuccinylase-like protein
VCCAEKGIFRFNITARGTAGHASLPRTGDNALLKLGPVLAALADPPEAYAVTEAPAALLRGLGEDPADPGAALASVAAEAPGLRTLMEPMLSVTLTPTMASASTKINVIPSRAQVRVDCRVPPGLGEDAARQRISEVLGQVSDDLEIEFTERVTGNQSPTESRLMTAIAGWLSDQDPEASAVPLILPGFSDSKWFRDAFPECVAYGFFPQRHQTLLETTPLVHNADERIDVRDLGFATACYSDLARELLG